MTAGFEWNADEYAEFRGRVAGLEQAFWEWSRSSTRARFIHPSLGHETAAFCVSKVLPPHHALWALYYRSHAWQLALGVSLNEIIAEIAGVSTGHLGGRAGSMHLLLHSNIIDCNSIVGAQIPIAVGAALANRAAGFPTVCVLGDGATNTGVFYESLNIASLNRAPILFVVEDNGVAMDSLYERISSASIESKFRLFSIPFFSAPSRDVGAVMQAVKEAKALVFRGPVAICVAGPRIGAHVLSSQDTWDDIAKAYTRPARVKDAMTLTYCESLELLRSASSTSTKEGAK